MSPPRKSEKGPRFRGAETDQGGPRGPVRATRGNPQARRGGKPLKARNSDGLRSRDSARRGNARGSGKPDDGSSMSTNSAPSVLRKGGDRGRFPRKDGASAPRAGGRPGASGRPKASGSAGAQAARSAPRWGSVARRGAREVTRTDAVSDNDGRKDASLNRPSASEAWRRAVGDAKLDGRPSWGDEWKPDEVLVKDPEIASRRQPSEPARGRPVARRHSVPKPVIEELAASGASRRSQRLAARLADASYAYEHDRFQEARRLLRRLVEEVPDAPSVRELYGLCLYRMGQWVPAARQLEVYRQQSGSYDQHPVMADCYRALGRYRKADQLWAELREASPSPDVVAEGRIVAAGCLADQGQIGPAIALLEGGHHRVKRPQERHLRQWYALGDLYERAGDIPRARELFSRVAEVDDELFDVRRRLAGLR